MRHFAILLGLLFVITASGAELRRGDIASAVFGDEATFKAFMSTTEVTAQRLHYRGGNADSFALSGYMRDDAVPVSARLATELRKLFSESKSYTWHRVPDEHGVAAMKACLPDYGVLLTFRGAERVIQIALCFECDLFAVFIGDDPQAKHVNIEDDSDVMRPQLIEIVRSLFPRDKDIQALQQET